MRLRHLIVVFAGLVATPARAVTLTDAFETALQKNESVPTQEEAAYQADETVKQAWGSLLPQVNFGTQWMWQEQVPNSNGLGLSPGWDPMTRLQATEPLSFGAFGLLSQAKHSLTQQRVGKDATELGLYKNLVAGFYSVLYLERDIQNLQEEAGYLRDRIKELERWRHIGRAQSTDVLTAKTTLAGELVKIEQDVSQLKAARDQFALLTGLPADVKLDDSLHRFNPTLDALDAYLAKIKERPDVRAQQAAVSASEENINVQKANHLPSLALTADRYFLRAGFQQDIDWDAMIVLTVPVFNGGVTQSRVRQAYSQSRQSSLALSSSERAADQEIRKFYDAVASDIKLKALNKENQALSEQTFKEEQKFFRNGLVTNLDVLTALTNYIEAKRALDQNRFNLRTDFLSLKAAVAMNKNFL